MATLSYVGYTFDATDSGMSHLTTLALIGSGSQTTLIGSTRYDGELRQWDLPGGTAALVESFAFPGSDFAGATGLISPLTFSTGEAVLLGGGAGGGLQLAWVGTDGVLDAPTTLSGVHQIYEGLQHTSTLTLADGSIAVYGALAGSSGIARLRFAENGTLLDTTVLYDATINTVAQVAATATAVTAGGNSFVLSTSSGSNTLTARAIDANGDFGQTTTLTADDSLWISAPTALETVEIGGITYAVLAAAGSDSLSVVEIGDDGSLTMRDHLLDTRDTRFGGVTTLDIVTVDGRTYVIAGGADDGVSVFALLEGGLLVHQAAIEDTVDVGLDNISALVGRGRGSGIDIFAASSSETGITTLRFDAGPVGITATAGAAGGPLNGTANNDILQGGAGNDLIAGGAGDDILRDGAGSDILTGGVGADLFILTQDGVVDEIRGFVVGEDKIDLSLWPMLRDISQLTIRLRPDGMEISYGDEVLIVKSADGGPIDYRALTNADLIGGSRLSAETTPGYAGPVTPVPGFDTPSGEEPDADQGGPNSILATLGVIATGNTATLQTALGGTATPETGMVVDGAVTDDLLFGSDGFDLILAGEGNDVVDGMDGDDTLFGRGGNDRLSGGRGADTLFGGAGDDILLGGQGHDRLDGGDGADVLNGGAGDDLLYGKGGADTFVFNGGSDLIADYEAGLDQIVLDASLWTGLTSAADLLMLYATQEGETVTITFDTGDVLRIAGVTDMAQLAEDITLF